MTTCTEPRRAAAVLSLVAMAVALAFALALAGCGHTAEARAASTATALLQTAQGARKGLSDWAVARNQAIPAEAAALCKAAPVFADCMKAEVARLAKPVDDAETALRTYVEALEALRAGASMDIGAAAAAIIRAAQAAKVLP